MDRPVQRQEREQMSLAEFKEHTGQRIGASEWHEINQALIDRFAEISKDHNFIHVDAERAKTETQFGGTIAHGFLTLSLLSVMAYEALPSLEGRKHGVNYGFDKLRFMAPVPSGSRVRGAFKLKSVEERSGKYVLFRYEVAVEIEGKAKPALLAEWLTLAVLQ